MIEKIKDFLRNRWAVLLVPMFGGGVGFSLAHAIMTHTLGWIMASVGWALLMVVGLLLLRQQNVTDYKVLEAKKEVVDSYTDLLEQTNAAIEYFNGYDEAMLESVAIYSQMGQSGVEAPIANSILAFSQELGPEHTILLIGIDHLQSKWSVRIAGRSIYLAQLKAIWALVNKHLEESAKGYGTIIIKKESSIMN